MKSFSLVLLLCVYALGVSAVSTFFEKGQRPEIFELTDNEIAVFKMTLPDEEFSLLKEMANVEGITPPVSNLTSELNLYSKISKMILGMYNFNFTELFPNVDVKEEFSGFYIGSDGFINIDEIMANMDFDPKNYVDFDFVSDNIINHLFVNGKHNYYDYFMKFASLQMEDVNEDVEAFNSATALATAILESAKNNEDTQINSINTILTNAALEEENFDENAGQFDILKIVEALSPTTENDFKTKNGTLTVTIGGEEKTFEKTTFSLSGQYSRSLVKPNFNLKIRGKKDLYGRSQFKLRSDLTEPTFLRSKLTSDIHKKMGLTSILANYATLYINDEYMGLFVLTDAYKLPWVEQVYGEKDTTHLFKCTGAHLTENSINNCKNENDEIEDTTEITSEWESFLNAIFKAQSAEDIEDIFEVDHFIKEMAIEYLLGAWDHLQLGHNYYLYKQPNGKWIYMTFDHDHSFGINLDRIFLGLFYVDLPERMENHDFDYPNYSFEKWTKKRHLIDILILNDPTRFNKALKEIVETVFNPATLFPRIDELKEFIGPLAEKDYTPDENGQYPGRINDLGINPYTLEHWEANSEFTTIETLQYNAYGIKYWILAKYRYVCSTYEDIECDPVYLDENYKYDVDEAVEFKGYDFSSYDLSDLYSSMEFLFDDNAMPNPDFMDEPLPTEVETDLEVETELSDNEEEDEYDDVELDVELESEEDSESETETSDVETF